MNTFAKNPAWTNIKAETEAEGASQSKIMSLKEYSDQLGLDLYVKIGGVEAKADLEFLNSIGIRGVIAPMVESKFGLEKFLDASSPYQFQWRALTIETINSYDNLSDILELAQEAKIQGITVGRGDFAASLGYKGEENSPNVMTKVSDIVQESNSRGFYTMIGGRMEKESLDTIWSSGLSVRGIETRRVALSFQDSFEATSESLVDAIQLELQIEQAILSNSETFRTQTLARIENLNFRLSQWTN